jgi:carboxypeptidase Q
MPSRHVLLALAFSSLTIGVAARDQADPDITWKIRREALEHSKILPTLHILTDVYGPRLTGSPNLKEAADWVVTETTSWGLANAHLESWDFGHAGWLNERFSAHVTAPVKDALVGEVLAWTPSTNGPTRTTVVRLEPPSRPSAEALDAYLAGLVAQVKGHAVLVGPLEHVAITFNPSARRMDEGEARGRFDPENPTPSPFANVRPPAPTPGRLTIAQANERIDQFLVTNGALVRINDAGRDHGQIRAFSNRTYDVTKTVPTIVLRNEDFGRLWRLSLDGRTVEVDVDVVNRVYPEGSTAYNVVAEIPGSDKKDEVVMLGAHLDSWHAATGATDNAIGCTIMLEAVRILKAIGVQPRRTIRLALWSGEEQGLLGSKAYVARHFGSFEQPKPEFAKLAGYVNIDSGTGRVRGLTVFGPPDAAAALRDAVKPLGDLGVVGATNTSSRRLGGTDSTSFNAAGLPGIGSTQDPMEYQSDTWHTNLDTYERIFEDDAQKAAITVATAVYSMAMRDGMLPRFTSDAMPKPEPETPPATTPSTPPTTTTAPARPTSRQ